MKDVIRKLSTTISTIIYIVSLLLFFTSFEFYDTQHRGGWTLQILPFSNQISDICFLDSLTGFCTTGTNDIGSNYIFKTTNGGENWISVYSGNNFSRIHFINQQTGFAIGIFGYVGNFLKTTDQGMNWISYNIPYSFRYSDMSVLNEDTIWAVSLDGLEGGLFRTTDGGQSWIRQFYQFNNNPERIYMFDENMGFMGRGTGATGTLLWKTTNGGFNWQLIETASTFIDIFFIDSLIGYKAKGNIQKTTDGGYNWIEQNLPTASNIYMNMKKLFFINKDTIWGVSGIYSYPNCWRGIIYKTTNGGNNWGYQMPDTSYGIPEYYFIKFVGKNIGWSFKYNERNVYTITGGSDTTIYTSVNNNISILNRNYELFQNYPNPFNSITNIKFKLKSGMLFAKIKIYDIKGKMIRVLTSKKYEAGEHTVRFDAAGLPSGVYFYRLEISGDNGKIYSETRKMILVK